MARGLDRESIFLDNADREKMLRLAYTVKEPAGVFWCVRNECYPRDEVNDICGFAQ